MFSKPRWMAALTARSVTPSAAAIALTEWPSR